MQALIKDGSESNPVWGKITFEQKGWRFNRNWSTPYVFDDNMTMDAIEALVTNKDQLEGYVLVPVKIHL